MECIIVVMGISLPFFFCWYASEMKKEIYEKMLRIQVAAKVLIALCIGVLAAAICIDSIGAWENPWEGLKVFKAVRGTAEAFFKSSGQYLMEGFGIIWGLAMSLILAVFEFSGASWYGITLKRLFLLSKERRRECIILLVFYALLYPIVYISESREFYLVTAAGICCTFLLFIGIPLLFLLMVRRKHIISVLGMSTKTQIQMDMKLKDLKIRRRFENLPITDMIRHLDYENAVETESLLDLMLEIFRKRDDGVKTADTPYEYLLLLFWLEKIVEKSGTDSRYKEEQTAVIVGELWERLQKEWEDSGRGGEAERDRRIIYALHILIPLLEYDWIFISVWTRFYEYRPRTVTYLLLYEEFKNTYWGERHTPFIDSLCPNYEWLRKESLFWDEELAWKLWIGWTNYWDKGNNAELFRFFAFRDDMNKIANGNFWAIRTYSMKKIVMKAGNENGKSCKMY